MVEETVRQGGNCLIPVFALGRAQELLLILDSFWKNNPDLHHIPIYYASRLAGKALRVYQTFVNMMNSHIRNLTDVGNPFRFQHITNMQAADLDSQGPAVVIASPGMLQNGVSRILFERWCDDERSSVVLAGYSVEGTLAKKLQQEPEEIMCLDGRVKPRRCNIQSISFSAHVDYIQNSQFIRSVVPDNIILVHGEKLEMQRLKDELDREIRHSWPVPHTPAVVMPRNGQPVTVRFSKTIKAEAVGSVGARLLQSIESSSRREAELPPDTVLVSEDFVAKVVSTSELSTYTSCRLGR